MANTYLTRTVSSSPTNPDKFTISVWVKRGNLSNRCIIGNYASSTFYGKMQFDSNDQLEYYQQNDGSQSAYVRTNRKFRDTNGFYHIVFAFDTSLGTASDRLKIYVNGVQETSMANSSYPAQNLDIRLNQASQTITIGQDGNGNGYFDGIMSHFHLVDGTALTASTFGSQDATTGEWKINTSPSYTVGDDGFFILKDTNSGTDQSANSNNFTVGGGTLTKTQDCPSNVFCTLNPLVGFASGTGTTHENAPTYSNGNTKYTKSQATWSTQACTLGATSGKYYWEAKMENNGGDPRMYIGIVDAQYLNDERGHVTGQTTNGVGYQSHNGNRKASGSSASYGNTWTSSNTMGIALDLDNHKIYFAKDNVWQNSGVPTSGSTGTGAISLTTGRTYIPSFTIHESLFLIHFCTPQGLWMSKNPMKSKKKILLSK